MELTVKDDVSVLLNRLLLVVAAAVVLGACGSGLVTTSSEAEESGCRELSAPSLESVNASVGVVTAQVHDGWGYRFLTDEESEAELEELFGEGVRGWTAVGDCSTSQVSPDDSAPVPNDLRISLSSFTSTERAREGYSWSAQWRENSDVWESPDSLEWFEEDHLGGVFRFECILEFGEDSCEWVAVYLREDVLLRMTSFRGPADDVQAYFEEFVRQSFEELWVS